MSITVDKELYKDFQEIRECLKKDYDSISFQDLKNISKKINNLRYEIECLNGLSKSLWSLKETLSEGKEELT
jgi:RNA:NAD 2'-phosphotransferase (TPT1/KptA family)